MTSLTDALSGKIVFGLQLRTTSCFAPEASSRWEGFLLLLQFLKPVMQ